MYCEICGKYFSNAMCLKCLDRMITNSGLFIGQEDRELAREIVTDKQLEFIQDLLRKSGSKGKALIDQMNLVTKEEASTAIDYLTNKKIATPRQLSYLNDLIHMLGYSLDQIREKGYHFIEVNGEISEMDIGEASKLIDLLKQKLYKNKQ